MSSFKKCILVVLTTAIACLHPSESQIHWGQTKAPGDAIECYNCSPYHGGFEFPKCLYVTDRCKPGQKCAIMYKLDQGFGLGPVIGCTNQCYNVPETPRLCPHGGGILSNWVDCYGCSNSSDGVALLTTKLSRDYFLSPKVFCPGDCHRSDIRECMSRGVECVESEFCLLAFDGGTQNITGMCRPATTQAQAACDSQINSNGACTHSVNELYHDPSLTQGSCLWGCLRTNVDVMVYFNHYPIHDFMTTFAPSTSP